MRIATCWALLALSPVSCTKRNPDYCEVDSDCEMGTCNTATNRCGFWEDAAGADAVPPVDADRRCTEAGGRIVFRTDRDGDAEIASMLADGTQLTMLTDNIYSDSRPRFSPDGSRIAWLSSPNGQAEVFVMDADGSDQMVISRGLDSPGNSSSLAWSPDGTKLAFQTDRDGNSEIYVVDVDGSNLYNVTSNAASDNTPSWSPDGSRLTFESSRDGNQNVYVVQVSGVGATPLTTFDDVDNNPAWSPAGTEIAFLSKRPNGPLVDLWRMNPDGSNQSNLTTVTDTMIYEFQWSPDGSALLYRWYSDIVWIDADGGTPINLTNDLSAAMDHYARWSPDGTYVIFATQRDGNDEIYRMQSNGVGATNLSNDPAEDVMPDWTGCQ